MPVDVSRLVERDARELLCHGPTLSRPLTIVTERDRGPW
jgi:hypothetical protein